MPNKERIDDEMITYLYKDSPFEKWPKDEFALWLRSGLRCQYCDRFLFTSYEAVNYGYQHDHLLPQWGYPRLAQEQSNIMLSCRLCNQLKLRWDPNSNGPPIYDQERDGGTLTEYQREGLRKRTRDFIAVKKLEKDRIFSEQRQYLRDKVPWLFPDEAG